MLVVSRPMPMNVVSVKLTYDARYPGVRWSKEQELLAEVLVLDLLLPLLLEEDVGGGDDGGGAEGGAGAAARAAQLRHGRDARRPAWEEKVNFYSRILGKKLENLESGKPT